MVKIIEKINELLPGQKYFSFEYFPPKTEIGVENLYQRMERMIAYHPLFVDITWGAGASTKDLTMKISEHTQKFLGADVLMHLTLTNLTVDEIKEILLQVKQAGIQNILALRGDPPKGALSWEPTPGGLLHTEDLVKLIRQEHGDYFCVGVAGFPEGHPHSIDRNLATDIRCLKQKIDSGADFVLTQFFYDPSVFLSYVNQCRSAGISCPIIPGMMPIHTFSSFEKMTSYCKTRVPEEVWAALRPIRENDEAVKAYGNTLCVKMCQTLYEAGIQGCHFYTLNLEKSVLLILKQIGEAESIASRRALPWIGSRSNLKGMTEDVRPINWANRTKSYLKRTVTWDEYPNGRWGDGRSPAFGELSDSRFFRFTNSKEDRLAMWGEAPLDPQEVFEIFAKYIEGKIPILPWCESSLQAETTPLTERLARLNRAGILTINSQPNVNGVKSDHPTFGWGGPGGRVYQKAYVEFFIAKEHLEMTRELVEQFPALTLHAVNFAGDSVKPSPHSSPRITGKGVTAITWGVFPNKEILQPTIFDHDTFLVWSEEAFQLWISAWAIIYDDETDSCGLIHDIHDNYFLVAIIDNDFVDSELLTVLDRLADQLARKKSCKSLKLDSESEDCQVGLEL